ncbi:SCPU domain-containing protein, partial [Pseudomonas sp. SIMBA_059]
MRPNLSCCMLAGLGLALASQAHAATVTGSINSTLTLISACQVNGSSGTSGLNFGALNFG